VQSWLEGKTAKAKQKVEGWKAQREVEKLVAHANQAEDYAAAAILVAAAAMQEAQVATLEAMEARNTADQATGEST
jgi:hypothetical protein